MTALGNLSLKLCSCERQVSPGSRLAWGRLVLAGRMGLAQQTQKIAAPNIA